MATEKQYACFKDIFDREAARQEKLIDRGKLYLSIITVYLGLLGVAADKLLPTLARSGLATAAFLASLACFVGSLVLVLLAIGIYKYVYPTDPMTVIDGYGPEPPRDEDFFDDRITELAAAFKTNQFVNERRADKLKYASFCLLGGVVFQAIVLASVLFLFQG
jgi:hypothetical protein